jgi:hypothetical protein
MFVSCKHSSITKKLCHWVFICRKYKWLYKLNVITDMIEYIFGMLKMFNSMKTKNPICLIAKKMFADSEN